LAKKNRKAKATFRFFENVPGVLHLQSIWFARVYNGNVYGPKAVKLSNPQRRVLHSETVQQEKFEPLLEGLFFRGWEKNLRKF
jgi:hypothetical protein